MRRRALRLGLPTCLGLLLFGQSDPTREGYRAAYKSWREADAGLELDAATAGEALAPRTVKVADAAKAYGTARITFLRDMADRQSENLKWLGSEVQPLPDPSPAQDVIRFVNGEIAKVSATASTFANDPDRVILQLRQALQREQDALEALRSAVTDRQKAMERADKAAAAAEQVREKELEQYPFLASALSGSAGLMEQEATAWAAYYPALAEASRLPAASTAPTISNVPNPPDSSAGAVASATPAPPRAPSITTLPLSRYVGVWAYQAGGAFLGTEPEFVDFAVHEANGHANGTFYARFKAPGDPVLRFDFSGDFTPDRIQTFKLETNDGATGTIELHPGGPFNVLEVNVNIDSVKPGKIHQADVMLVKQ